MGNLYLGLVIKFNILKTFTISERTAMTVAQSFSYLPLGLRNVLVELADDTGQGVKLTN